MESRPKIAVVGSCVSRDVFNSDIIPKYKENIDLVSEVFQSSVVGLARESSIFINNIPVGIKPNHITDFSNELSGRNLNNLVDSTPDYVIIDLFADIHFGITKILGSYATRNHMAFDSKDDASLFYGDTDLACPDRVMLGRSSHEDEYYLDLLLNSLTFIREKMHDKNPNTSFIVNSARYTIFYVDEHEQTFSFEDQTSLKQKNFYWDKLDERAVTELEAFQIKHPDEMLTAYTGHKWGLHPVHYTNKYYLDLWSNIREITH